MLDRQNQAIVTLYSYGTPVKSNPEPVEVVGVGVQTQRQPVRAGQLRPTQPQHRLAQQLARRAEAAGAEAGCLRYGYIVRQ